MDTSERAPRILAAFTETTIGIRSADCLQIHEELKSQSDLYMKPTLPGLRLALLGATLQAARGDVIYSGGTYTAPSFIACACCEVGG